MRIVWSAAAVDDLHGIYLDILEDNRPAAAQWLDRLSHSVDHLSDFPLSGRAVPEPDFGGFREVIVPPFRVIYSIEGDTLYVHLVIHGSRLLPLDRR